MVNELTPLHHIVGVKLAGGVHVGNNVWKNRFENILKSMLWKTY